MVSYADLVAACRPYAGLTCEGGELYRLEGLHTRLHIHIVSSPADVPDALRRLRQSLRDNGGSRHVAIDLEWRPDFYRGSDNPVALIQLASASMCLLVRTCKVGFPHELQAFLSDPSLTFVGLNWAQSDARKMQSSFAWESSRFGGFVDLAHLATRLGYPKTGLDYLAEAVLGANLPKSKSVTLSNWAAARELSEQQIRYAALDAFATYHVHAMLARLW